MNHEDTNYEKKVTFRRSSYCSYSTCVEVAEAGDTVVVRDSKTGATLSFDRQEWRAFVLGVQDSEAGLLAGVKGLAKDQ